MATDLYACAARHVYRCMLKDGEEDKGRQLQQPVDKPFIIACLC